MLRFAPPITSASDVKAYYLEGSKPFRADYYMENEGIGMWGGRGAERLELSGRIERLPFERLADNLHPTTGNRLTPRTKATRRVGYDLSFHVPKSVSLAWAFGKDDRIIGLIRFAAKRTLDLMEPETQTRVRIDGQSHERDTGELTYAMFTHLTARPPQGSDVPDPLLHVHAFLFNHTWDAEESRYKAVDIARIQRDMPYHQAVFHSIFSNGLQQMGYPLERKGGKHVAGYEIAGVPDGLIQKFSQRDQEIRREIDRLGITDPNKKARMAERTRSKKGKRYSLEQLRSRWGQRLDLAERGALAFMRRASIAPEVSADRALDHATEHCFERLSSVRTRELLRVALKAGVGSVRLGDLTRTFNRRPWVRDTDAWDREIVTTHAMQKAEREVADFAREGKGRFRPLGRSDREFGEIDSKTLSREQEAAAREILASTDRVTLLSGKAGVGKTTMMRHVEEALRETGRSLVPLAPSAKAARGVLQKDGFLHADTVASFFERPAAQRRAYGQVIWVDEASLMGVASTRKLFGLADKLKARVLLSADPLQHKSVEAGDILRTLTYSGGVKPIELSTIRRQRGEYLRAVESLSRGDMVEGFDRLQQMGSVIEIGSDQRHRRMASDYVETVSKGQTALAVAPTKAEGREVTGWIRRDLKDRGLIDGTEREYTHLRDLQLTNAEKRQGGSYEIGDIILFHRSSGRHGRGARLTVVGRKGDNVMVLPAGSRLDGDPAGWRVQEFDRQLVNHVGVYRPESVAFARGDLVMVSQNTRSKNGRVRLDNGHVARIAEIRRDGDLVLQKLARDKANPRTRTHPRFRQRGRGRGFFRGHFRGRGVVVSGDNGFLTHGYCVTSPKSQGDTVGRTFVAEGAESFAAASREQFYTTVSRGRLSCTIYTDDIQGLRRAIERSESVKTALELAAWAEDPGRESRQRALDSLRHVNQRSNARVDARRLAVPRDREPHRPARWPKRVLQRIKGLSLER